MREDKSTALRRPIAVVGAEREVVDAVRASTSRVVHAADRLASIDAPLSDIVAVAGHVPGEAIAHMPRLVWVHSFAAGPDADLTPQLRHSPVVMTSSAGNGAVALAEHAMMMLLQLDREERLWALAQQEHRWHRRTHSELAGKTIGLFGLGNAGVDLVAKARAFHMRVVACRRDPSRSVEGVERIYSRADFHEFLAECDAVVVTAPLTPETRGIFDEYAFRAMKPSAFWICVSRGGIADDSALLRALRDGAIAGAGIDAHTVEPLPVDSPFWSAPNVILTPHNGATTRGTARRGLEILLENLERFEAGMSLRNVVDKEAGY